MYIHPQTHIGNTYPHSEHMFEHLLSSNAQYVIGSAIPTFILILCVFVCVPSGAHTAVNLSVQVLVRSSRSFQHSELLHLRVLELLLELVRCSAGPLLTDESLCLVFEECFALRQGPSASHLLEAYADDILVQFVLVVFARLNHMKVRAGDTANPTVPTSVSSTSSLPLVPDVAPEHGYGSAAFGRILRFLARLLDPSKNVLHLRVLGLRLVNTALETGGGGLSRHKVLVLIVQDELCKALLQNSQSTDSTILTLVLRIVFDLLQAVKEHLRVQLEVFFTSIHLRIVSSPSVSFMHRQLVLQSIVEICHEPELIVGLYRNYDCEMAGTNLFEDLCRLLASQALPHSRILPSSDDALHKASGGADERGESGISQIGVHDGLDTDHGDLRHIELTNLHVLSLEAILAIVASIAKRFCTPRLTNTTNAKDDDADIAADEEEFDEEELRMALALIYTQSSKYAHLLTHIY